MKILYFHKFYFYIIVNNIREKEKIKLAHIKKMIYMYTIISFSDILNQILIKMNKKNIIYLINYKN